MGLVYEYFTFNGKSSLDFEVMISGGGTFKAPDRDVESIAIPGRNGDLHIDNGRFSNIEVVYPAFIVKAFRKNFDAFKAFMLSQRGYKELADSYHPEYFRLASYKSAIEPKMTPRNLEGSFDIVFDCDPRRFLKTGQKTISANATSSVKNPTLFNALPKIRAYGTGTLTINGISITISTADVYTEIDCETQEAYKGSTSCNSNITLTDGAFPYLSPGLNSLSYTGLTNFTITPRYWTV